MLGHGKGILAVPFHTQRKGLDSLNELPGIIRRDAGTEVTQRHGAHSKNVGKGSERLGEVMPPAEAVVAAVWLIVEGEVTILPVKGSGIDHDPANPIALSTKPLGKGMDHDTGPMLDRTGEVGGGKGTVHNQGNAMVGCDLGNGFQIGHIEARVAHRFAKEGLGLRSDRRSKILGVVGVDKVYLDPKLGQNVIKLGIGATIEVVGRYNFIPRFGEVDDGVKYRTGTGCDPETGGTSLKGSHPLLEHIGGGVHQAGIDIAQFAQPKEIGSMLGVVEDKGTGLVNGYGAGIGGRVGLVASVEALGL